LEFYLQDGGENQLEYDMESHVLSHLNLSVATCKYITQCMSDFVGAKLCCPPALADSNQHIWIREKTLEFSSTVLSTLSLYSGTSLWNFAPNSGF